MPISCTPSDLVELAKCLCFDAKTQDAVEILLLCTWAGGGAVEIPHLVLGDPDAPFIFGDSGTGTVFGVP